jgi:hypothetical protein
VSQDLLQPSSLVPATIPAAIHALQRMRVELTAAKTYDQIRRIERSASAIKLIYAEVETVKIEAGKTIVEANAAIGEQLEQQPLNVGGDPVTSKLQGPATQAELVGTRMRASRCKRLFAIPKRALANIMDKIAAAGRDITVTTVLKEAAGEETKERRERSRAAPVIGDGMDLRIGDCRIVLADIADNSVPLIITDPPYGDEAEPLYEWLAQWAQRVLIPGGSLICYTGQSRLNRDMRILDDHLRYWWTLAMLHDQSQRLAGKFVIPMWKPVLWYVKDHRDARRFEVGRPRQGAA